MKTDLDHLPERRRAEVEYVRDIVLEEMQRRVDASPMPRAGNASRAMKRRQGELVMRDAQRICL